MPANLENSAMAQDWKRSVFIPIPKKSNAKEHSNYRTIALISHASKTGFSNMWTMNLQMFQVVLEKAEEPEIKLPTSAGSSKKQESSRKTSISALLTIPKPLTVWITTNWKILKEMGMWELDCEEGWAPKNWCFWPVVLEKTLESPLDCKEIQPVHPKGDQSWVFIGRTDAKAETPVLWPPDGKNWLIWKDPDAYSLEEKLWPT